MDDEHIPYEHAFTITTDYRRVIAGALWVRHIWVAAVLGIVILTIGLGASVPLNIGGPAIAGLILAVASPFVVYDAIRRTVRRQLPLGATLRSGFSASSFRLGGPEGSSTMTFRSLQSVDVRGELVHLRLARSRRRYVAPRALFPDAEIIRIRMATAAADSSSA